MNLLYVTKELPYGAAETFIYAELAEHLAHGCQVTVAPVKKTELVHASGRELVSRTLGYGLFSPEILKGFIAELASRPVAVLRTLASTIDLSRPKLIPRNMAVWAKGVWLAREAAKRKIDHIHVHWIAVPATMAMIASRLSGIPMSITAHRYDIAQRNLIPQKFQSSCFVRAIDGPGAAELGEQLEPGQTPPVIIRMGVSVSPEHVTLRGGVLQPIRAIIGARYVPKKGHATLLSAVAEARRRGVNVELDAFGDGPLLKALEDQRDQLGLGDLVRLNGTASHHELLAKLLSGDYDVGVLPSVVAEDGDKEGIPVFLMESMCAGLPVISTPNGGIVELISEGTGILVPEYDVDALAAAFVQLATDPELRAKLGAAGRQKVIEEFAIAGCAAQLRRLFAAHQAVPS